MNYLAGFILCAALFLPEQGLKPVMQSPLGQYDAMAEKNVSEHMTGQMAKPLVVLACLPDGQQSQTICSILQEHISHRLPGHVFRRVTVRPSPPGRPEDMAVTLHLTRQSATHVAAQLEWQTSGAAPKRGPELQISAQGSSLTHALLTDLVVNLLATAPGLAPVKK